MSRRFIAALVIMVAVAFPRAQDANEALFEAARAGDVARIEAALAQGAGINATSRYNVTPLIFAASSGRLDAVKKGSYIAAWDLNTGKQLWKTARTDEIPTWGTPAIMTAPSGRSEIVTNGTKIRGYDPASGKLLWTLGPNSEVTVGTPVTGHGLVFVTGGYPPVRPIYAIRPGAAGDISPPTGSDSSEAIAWSNMTDGTYIPTPLVYGDYLFTMNNNGIVNAYSARTGQRAFRGRIGEGGAFSASLVAADGRLYAASQDGEMYVVTAGPGLTQIAKNDMKEIIMATRRFPTD